MGVLETLVIYFVIGVVIAGAMHAARQEGSGGLATWLVLWPFYAPALLGRALSVDHPHEPVAGTRIEKTRARLLAAIERLDGLAQDVLKPQRAQIEAMMTSMEAAERRLAEMEELLATPEFDRARVERALGDLEATPSPDPDDSRLRSLLARRRNIDRLEEMRDGSRRELERAFARLEEIVSQILLLRFADEPEAKLADLLREVAGSVEDLSGAVFEAR